MKDKTNVKRKLLTDRNFPNSEKISQRKDLNNIQKNHAMIKKGLLKKALAWGGAIAGTAIIAAAIYLNGITNPVMEKPVEKKQTVEMKEACILPPLQGKETPFSTFRISVKTGGVINYKTGSTLTIPANAFLSSNGKPVSDSIDIKYREYHNPCDIFLSGIPMKYDSAGTQYTFESAGMIEILAFDGNEKLKLKEQSPIEITMASTNDDTRFNIYRLDTISKNWVYLGKDKVTSANNNKTEKNSLPENEKGAPKVVNEEELITPIAADPKKFCFNIGYDKKDFPELAAYDNVLFEGTDNNFKPSFYKINWDKISLLSTDIKGNFIVKLKKADTSISVNAKPVFNKGDYNSALAKFEARHKQVVEVRNRAESEMESKLKKINKDLSNYNRRDFIAASNFRVNRTFSILVLGITNCDNPMPQMIPAQTVAQQLVNLLKQEDRDDKQLQYSTIYIVEKGKNTVFRFSKNEPLLFNPKAQNLIWTITNKNEIAFFPAIDYKKLSLGKQNKLRPVLAKNQETALVKIKTFSN